MTGILPDTSAKSKVVDAKIMIKGIETHVLRLYLRAIDVPEIKNYITTGGSKFIKL